MRVRALCVRLCVRVLRVCVLCWTDNNTAKRVVSVRVCLFTVARIAYSLRSRSATRRSATTTVVAVCGLVARQFRADIVPAGEKTAAVRWRRCPKRRRQRLGAATEIYAHGSGQRWTRAAVHDRAQNRGRAAQSHAPATSGPDTYHRITFVIHGGHQQ